MIRLKDETQKEIVKDIIRTKNVYLKYFQDEETVLYNSVAITRNLLQVLWYSKGIDLQTKKRLANYMSKKFYKEFYI